MLLKVLCGIEHLARAPHRRQDLQFREFENAGAPILLKQRDVFLQLGEVCLPIFQQSFDAFRRGQSAAGDGAEVENVIAENDSGESAAAALCRKSAELEWSAVHGFFASE